MAKLICEAIIPCANCLSPCLVVDEPKEVIVFIKEGLKVVCSNCGHVLGELKSSSSVYPETGQTT